MYLSCPECGSVMVYCEAKKVARVRGRNYYPKSRCLDCEWKGTKRMLKKAYDEKES